MIHTDDWLIRAPRIVCPRSGVDGPGTIVIRRGRIAGGTGGGEDGCQVIDLTDTPGAVVLPGLVDFHAHPARSGSRYGVSPDAHLLPMGTTTVLSQGDAGARNLERYLSETIAGSLTRVRLALNLSSWGESRDEGCIVSLDDADVAACADAILRLDQANLPDNPLWGIAVNTSVPACGSVSPHAVLDRALTVAELTSRPLLVGLRRAADWPLEEQLPLLRAGDVVTYCFSPGPEALVRDGQVRKAAWEARDRGVLFDLGHGMASFSFEVAEVAVNAGFLPHSVSTDFYRRHLGEPVRHHLPRTMAKLRACGMSELDLFTSVTSTPAGLLGLGAEIGHLGPGAVADLAVLEWTPGSQPLTDTVGGERLGGEWVTRVVFRAGQRVV